MTGDGFNLTLGGTQGGSIATYIATGAGSLIKQDLGTWTLSGTNTYTGGTLISAGTLKVNNSTALGTGSVAVTFGAALDLNGTTMTTANALTLNGTGVSSSGALTNSSATAATFAGSLALGSNASVISSAGSIILSNTASTITLGSATGYVLTLGGAGGGSIAGVIGQATGNLVNINTLIKQDAGTWTLSGANTYSSGTSISGGTLKFATSYATTASSVTSSPIGTGNLTITAGGTLDQNGYDFGGSTQTSNIPTITMSGTGAGSLQALLINSSSSISVTNYAAINLTKISGTAGTLVDVIAQAAGATLTIAGVVSDGTGTNAAGLQVGQTDYSGTVLF